MNTKEFKTQMWNKLLSIDSATKVSDTQIIMRCQLCGDSKYDLNKKRFGVKININDDSEPIMFNCFNCGASGVLTPSVLRSFHIHDLTLSSGLISYNKTSVSKYNKKMGITNNNFKFTPPRPLNTSSNVAKKKYIEGRLGIALTVDELLSLKAVFSLQQFLNSNDINSITTPINRCKEIEMDYVGFLTVNNEFIIYRDITNKHKLRYDKYSIYRNIDNTRKFYSIPTKINMLTTETIYINIAEGVFDILGVYYHIKDKDMSNNIYAAVTGSAYIQVIKYFLKLGLIGNNIVINIFSDNDKSPYYYKKLIDEISPWVKEINLLYNNKGHDFGVHKDKIEVIKKRL